MHILLEIAVLGFLTNNLVQFGESYVWQNWSLVHMVAGIALWVIGLVGGVWGGFRYWRILYIEESYGKPRF